MISIFAMPILLLAKFQSLAEQFILFINSCLSPSTKSLMSYFFNKAKSFYVFHVILYEITYKMTYDDSLEPIHI